STRDCAGGVTVCVPRMSDMRARNAATQKDRAAPATSRAKGAGPKVLPSFVTCKYHREKFQERSRALVPWGGAVGKHLLLFVVGVSAGAVAVYVTLDAAAPRRDEGAAAPVRREAEAAPRTSFAVDRLVAIGGAGLGMSVRGLREAIA